MTGEMREEERRIKTLTTEALSQLGHTDCLVIVPMPPSPTLTNEGNYLTWTFRVTDNVSGGDMQNRSRCRSSKN
jgi:hypothetical protein